VVRASPNAPPALTIFARLPPGRRTWTGVRREVLVPSPSWPYLLLPQASTWPPVVSASAKNAPVLIALTLTPLGNRTRTGTSLPAVLPLPSMPPELAPQASTWPLVVRRERELAAGPHRP